MFTVGKRTNYFKKHDFKEPVKGDEITKTEITAAPVEVIGVVSTAQKKTETGTTGGGGDVLSMIQDINKKG